MIDKWQGLHSFWSSFDLPAYDETDVPENATMPYITYDARVSGFEVSNALSASVWDRSTSWAAISQKVDEIARALTPYKLIPLEDNQYLFLIQGSPFAQRMPDEDSAIRRIYINVMGEYFTRY